MTNSIATTELNGVIMEVYRNGEHLEFGTQTSAGIFTMAGYMHIDYNISANDNFEALELALEHFERTGERINADINFINYDPMEVTQ